VDYGPKTVIAQRYEDSPRAIPKPTKTKTGKWDRTQDDGCVVLDVIDTYGFRLLNAGFLKVTYGSTVMYDDWNLGPGFFMSFGNNGCSPGWQQSRELATNDEYNSRR
jgi:hypothetical protein